MTRHQRFDVRVAPEVEKRMLDLAERSGAARVESRHIRAALLLLGSMGTRAHGAKKLKSLELWEIRAGRHRLFFTLVPGTRRLAVGALIAKDARRIGMTRLKLIERKVHLWRDKVLADR